MKIIFNADDFGYSEAVNRGIVKCFKDGVLRSTTLMTNAFGFDDAIELSRKNPSLGIGVHLTLTFGKPLLNKINTLTDKNGNFHKLSFFEAGNQVDEEQLFEEWDAQIKKVISAGITPTHLDSHHHIHTFGTNTKVVKMLGEKYQLPIRNNLIQEQNKFEEIHFDVRIDQVGTIKIDDEYSKNIEKLEELFWREVEGKDIVEVMCHPAYLDYDIVENSSFVIPRVYQLKYLTKSAFARSLLNDESIQLVSYKGVKKRK